MAVLDQYPLPWQDSRIQGLLAALAAAAYKSSDIESLVILAGVPPEDIPWASTGRNVWFAAMTEAAGRGLLPTLVQQAVDRHPQLGLRIGELLADRPVVSAPLPPGDPLALTAADSRWRNFSADNRERRIVDSQDTMLDVAFLQQGLDSARSVCRLTAVFGGAVYFGTAFRVGPRTLLTNHHVLHDWEHGSARPSSVHADFRYELGVDGKLRTPTAVACDVTTIGGERDHDFAVIQTATDPPADVTVLPLDPAASVQLDDRVYTVQHPAGLPKKIALAHNLVRSVTDDAVQYWTDTEAGSSGSPVFDDSWRVVALHHQWVEAPSGDGPAYRNQGGPPERCWSGWPPSASAGTGRVACAGHNPRTGRARPRGCCMTPSGKPSTRQMT